MAGEVKNTLGERRLSGLRGHREAVGESRGGSSGRVAERGCAGPAGHHVGRWCPQAQPSHLSSPLEAVAAPPLLQKPRGSCPNALWGPTFLTPEDEHSRPAVPQRGHGDGRQCQTEVQSRLQRGCRRWHGRGGGRLLGPPLWKPLVAAGPSRGDMVEEGVVGGCGCAPRFIYLFGWLGCGGGSGNFLGQCTSAASRAALASPADPSGERHRHRLRRGPVVPGSSARVAWATPGPFLPTANWGRRNPPRAAAGWVGNS